jgi:hypothetical protein
MKESLIGFSIEELMKLRKAMNRVNVDIEHVIKMVDEIPEPKKIVFPTISRKHEDRRE